MQDMIVEYKTRGGIQLAIKLPLNEFGEVLADEYLTDSELRRLNALRLRTELRERETIFITVH